MAVKKLKPKHRPYVWKSSRDDAYWFWNVQSGLWDSFYKPFPESAPGFVSDRGYFSPSSDDYGLFRKVK